MPTPLPEFDRQPLDEVVMGVQFEPLKEFGAVHLGLYWSRIRDRYPFTEDQPSLPHETLSPDPKPEPKPPRITVRTVPFSSAPLRCWFVDQSKHQLIQVQHDRFLRNWRQLQGSEPYLRFSTLIQQFKREWEGFATFVQEEGLGPINVSLCELSYINLIEKGDGWESFSDLPMVFPVLRISDPSGFLPAPEVFAWKAQYKLPNDSGKLNVEMSPAFRSRDMKFVLSFTLTAKGAPVGGSLDESLPWFDLAHEWVVRGFHELTSQKMHELWKERQ